MMSAEVSDGETPFTRSARRQRTTEAGNSQAVSASLEPQLERIDALFVQGAARFTSRQGTMTLHGLAESTVYFADRPRREIGHIPSRRFVELWAVGAHSFAVDPPNAVISFLDEEGDASDVVVVLHEATLEGDDVTYRITVLEGKLPEEAGPCSLFIDVFRRPLLPVSVAESKHGAQTRKRSAT
jgi:hypothetical protein